LINRPGILIATTAEIKETVKQKLFLGLLFNVCMLMFGLFGLTFLGLPKQLQIKANKRKVCKAKAIKSFLLFG